MFPRRPEHLKCFDYIGEYAYFLTFCTDQRHEAFVDAERVRLVSTQILRAAVDEGFQLTAYCYMPDHLHLVITATCSDSDLREFVARAKQSTGFYFKKATQQRLWQRYGYERVLRNEEEKIAFIRYVIQNAIRAELVESPLDYPFWGSSICSREELLDYLGIVCKDRRAG